MTMNFINENLFPILGLVAIIGWGLYIHKLIGEHRRWKMPKVSDQAIIVGQLIFRDFLKMAQTAVADAKAAFAQEHGGATAVFSLVERLNVQPAAASSSHSAGVKWDIEYNPEAFSFVNVYDAENAPDTNLKLEIWHFLQWKFATSGGSYARVQICVI